MPPAVQVASVVFDRYEIEAILEGSVELFEAVLEGKDAEDTFDSLYGGWLIDSGHPFVPVCLGHPYPFCASALHVSANSNACRLTGLALDPGRTRQLYPKIHVTSHRSEVKSLKDWGTTSRKDSPGPGQLGA
ncbi:hypothetical protein NMY22_g5285 [Coprinellus aureogranulatus]|nr:hypothetical protein NMY22_g5285 [Coprinellus aureogranulatus]